VHVKRIVERRGRGERYRRSGNDRLGGRYGLWLGGLLERQGGTSERRDQSKRKEGARHHG
jgi:hypothetical protein